MTLEELGNRIHIEVKELEQYARQGLLNLEEIQSEEGLEQLKLLDDWPDWDLESENCGR